MPGKQHDWLDDARCKKSGVPLNYWFAPENTHEAAKATYECWDCPVRLQCLEDACAQGSLTGEAIWGGVPYSERLRMEFDFTWLSYEPNVYKRDAHYRGGYSKFAKRYLKHWRGNES